MGIDPIGKGGGPIPPTGSPGVGAPTSADTFSIDRATPSQGADTVSALDLLKSGRIDVARYLDLRVEQATSHLVGRVDEAQLAFIRSSLRSELETDPVLMDLVHRATGKRGESTDRG